MLNHRITRSAVADVSTATSRFACARKLLLLPLPEMFSQAEKASGRGECAKSPWGTAICRRCWVEAVIIGATSGDRRLVTNALLRRARSL